jgi:hypothetical protein
MTVETIVCSTPNRDVEDVVTCYLSRDLCHNVTCHRCHCGVEDIRYTDRGGRSWMNGSPASPGLSVCHRISSAVNLMG